MAYRLQVYRYHHSATLAWYEMELNVHEICEYTIYK